MLGWIQLGTLRGWGHQPYVFRDRAFCGHVAAGLINDMMAKKSSNPGATSSQEQVYHRATILGILLSRNPAYLIREFFEVFSHRIARRK
jgi:hypothetical protein